MNEAKKVIVRKLEFSGLMHISLMNVPHKLSKELANSFNLDKNKLDTRHRDLFSDKEKTLKNLTDQMIDIDVDNDQDHLMFKRIFILYIQMVFLLPTTINKTRKEKQSLDSPGLAIGIESYWLRGSKRCKLTFRLFQSIVKRTEMKKKLKEMKEKEKKRQKKTKKKKTQSKKEITLLRIRLLKNKLNRMITDIRTEEIEELFRESKQKKPNEKATHGMKEAGLPSTKGHYDSSEIMPEVNLRSENDPMFQT
ncbi:hypothetical protein Ahy_A04g019013 [Arachis hypogaea]|uniref:Uncharacterized protein n=1 Tax=Arachis hypogaea TaxID=3818 RepID=A0A445DFA1_ARAHY|nr:hypothetical protein Ahy_A04g019013 [Arachis hypogaea]